MSDDEYLSTDILGAHLFVPREGASDRCEVCGGVADAALHDRKAIQTQHEQTIGVVAAIQAQRADSLQERNRRLEEKIREMSKALISALALQNAMLNEIRRLAASKADLRGVVPVQLSAAQNNFAREMKKVLTGLVPEPGGDDAA